ncbi:MAG: hypothetical protein NC192_00845 [Muribaculaceae bacterium]|nr:hypothetical protein [Muribaculaceae bacterium]
MSKNKKEHAKIPPETAAIIDDIESLKYRAAALMKSDGAEITPEMSAEEVAAVMDKYLNLAEKKLAEEKLKKTEENVMAEILRLQKEIAMLRQNMEDLSKGENK